MGEVVDIIGGGTPSKNIKEYYNGSILWASVRDMKNEILDDTEFKITEKALVQSSSKIIPKDNIIIATRVGLGKVCMLGQDTAINQDLKGIIPKNKQAISKYLFYWFKSISKILEENGTGATVKGVKVEFIANLPIPLPPLEEQRRVVEKLYGLFAKIDKSIALLDVNIASANALMPSALNEVFKELAENWEKKKLNQIVKEGGKTISTLEYPNLIYFSLEDIEAQSGKILKYQTVSQAGVKGTAVMFDADCVLYSKLRPYLNKVVISDCDGCSTTELVVLKPMSSLNKYFLAYILRSPKIVNFLHNDSMGAKMPRTNMKTFRELEIPFPPLNIQLQTIAYLDVLHVKTEALKKAQVTKKTELLALKASLLESAFKGDL